MKRNHRKQREERKKKIRSKIQKSELRRAKKFQHFAPISVDSEPIRQGIVEEFQKIQTHLKKKTKQLQEFHQQDVPEFERWRHVAFSRVLSNIQVEEQNCHKLETQLNEIARYVTQYGITDSQAFTLMRLREQNPQEYRQRVEKLEAVKVKEQRSLDETSQRSFFGNDGQSDFGFDEFEEPDPERESDDDILMELLVMECFLLGISPDRISPQMLHQLKQLVFRKGSRPDRAAILRILNGTPEEPEADQRLKQVFRRLARRLHPDFKGSQQTEAQKQLWYAAQQAYQSGDLEKLYSVEALISLHQGHETTEGTLSDLYRAVEHTRCSLGAVDREIRKARQHPGWKFRQKKGELPKGKFVRVKTQIQRHFESTSARRQELEGFLACARNPHKSYSMFHPG